MSCRVTTGLRGSDTRCKFEEMKITALGAIGTTILFSAFCLAQNAQPSSKPTATGNSVGAHSEASRSTPPAAPRIAAGSVIPVQLAKTVDAKKAKTGEEVTAKVTMDLKTSSGMMLMPKNTEIVGHVTEVQARNKQDKESQIGIVFDHAVMNSGSVNYPLSIQAVISPTALQNSSSGDQAGGTPPAAPIAGETPGGRSNGMGGMGGGGEPPPPNEAPAGAPSGTSSGGKKPPAITGHTEGVIGFQNLSLSNASSPRDGSIVSSDKNNVKLDSGTLMLLRVSH